MKIIKKVEPKEPEKKTMCCYCKTIFVYNNSDIKPDRDGSYVVCPSCEKFIAADYLTHPISFNKK